MLSKEEWKRTVVDAIRNGETVEAVAKQAAISSVTLIGWCQEADVSVSRKKHTGNPSVWVVVKLLVGGGLSQAAIARKTGVSSQYVSLIATHLKEAGVKLPQPPLRKMRA